MLISNPLTLKCINVSSLASVLCCFISRQPKVLSNGTMVRVSNVNVLVVITLTTLYHITNTVFLESCFVFYIRLSGK